MPMRMGTNKKCNKKVNSITTIKAPQWLDACIAPKKAIQSVGWEQWLQVSNCYKDV